MNQRHIAIATAALAAALLAGLTAIALGGEQLLGAWAESVVADSQSYSRVGAVGFSTVALLLAVSWHLTGYRLAYSSDGRALRARTNAPSIRAVATAANLEIHPSGREP